MLEPTANATTNQVLAPIPHQGEDFDAWLKWKSQRIGGRNAATIAGVNPHQTLPQLFDRIVHGIVPTMDEETLEFLEWCSMQEDLIARRYMKKTGRKVRRTQSSYHKDDPRVISSPDRIILNDERGPGIHEIKSRSPYVFQDILDYGAPEADWVQDQHYMMTAGYQHGTITEANRDNGQMINVDIDADPVFQEVLWERIQNFLSDCDKGIRPTIERPEPMRVPASGIVTVLDESNEVLVAQFARIINNFEISRALNKDAEALHKANKKAFINWMKDNGFEMVDCFGRRASAKWQKGRKSLDKDLFAGTHPAINLDDFNVEGNAFQVARVNSPKAQIQTDLKALIAEFDKPLLGEGVSP